MVSSPEMSEPELLSSEDTDQTTDQTSFGSSINISSIFNENPSNSHEDMEVLSSGDQDRNSEELLNDTNDFCESNDSSSDEGTSNTVNGAESSVCEEWRSKKCII